ncbi:DUF711 family protein [Nonomuraea sp. NPDC049400]|uniref:DUF711 family protein n=1 Tax=Nonomuraea sp. NPDC049400 TaxID=3364352 RepID=UPI0037BB4C34
MRTVCMFSRNPHDDVLRAQQKVERRLSDAGYTIQTRRIVAPVAMAELARFTDGMDIYPSVGRLSAEEIHRQLDAFYASERMCCHLDLTDEEPTLDHVALLMRFVREAAPKTFYFSYVFSNVPSSPFFPSAAYERPGFSVGLQPTDLAAGCESQEEWFARMRSAWEEIVAALGDMPGFLGIDSSVAPLGSGAGSLIDFVGKRCGDLRRSLITDFYVRTTTFVKQHNPKPVGLCGLMFPCLEDFELSIEYEKGNFDLATNLYLSMHSGLGIDTYPIGTDEDPEVVLDVLKLLRALSLKYGKPLSARFISDGNAGIGENTDFRNSYLRDVAVRKLGR